MSTATQLTGLASGLDWKTLVANLIDAERTPETALKAKQTTYSNQTSALSTLNEKLTALKTSVDALAGSSDNFSSRSASSASATGLAGTWTASAATGTDIGTYSIDVSQLATRAKLAGQSDVGAALSATTDVSGLTVGTLPIANPITEGDFTVNGARITISKTDSLQDVFNKISTGTGGAVTASYDPATDKVKLSGTGEIVLGSANDTSNFLTSFQLFNNGTNQILSPKAAGVVSVSAAIANANLKQTVTAVDASGNGSFQINGVNIAYNVNTDSIQSIMSKINTSTAGVTASFDKTGDGFILTNKTTGDTGIAITEGAGGLLGAMGLTTGATLNRGLNAQFSIDGGATRTSTSNTLDETVTGISGLSVTATTEDTQTVTVGADTSGLKSKIQDFITNFNAIQTFVSTTTKTTTASDGTVTTSLFSGDREISDMGNALRSLAFGTVPGLTGAVQRLQSMGIDFTSGTSQLAIKDSAALDNALANNGDDVKKLFSDSSNGLVTKLDAYLTQLTGSTGMVATHTSSITKKSQSIDQQIATMEKNITSEQARLEASFEAMETAQSQIQSQGSALTSAFGSTK